MNATTSHAAAYGFSSSLRPKVISVNPCRATLAKLNAIDFRAPRRAIMRRRRQAPAAPTFLALLFPVRQMTFSGSVLLLLLRLAFGAYLIASGFDLLEATEAPAAMTEHVWAAIQIMIGALSAAGILTRVVMAFPTVVFSMLVLSSPTFHAALAPLCCATASAIILATGSGWLSCDALMRVAIRGLRARKVETNGMPPVLNIAQEEEQDSTLPLITLVPADD